MSVEAIQTWIKGVRFLCKIAFVIILRHIFPLWDKKGEEKTTKKHVHNDSAMILFIIFIYLFIYLSGLQY